jgi:hypothetical protein
MVATKRTRADLALKKEYLCVFCNVVVFIFNLIITATVQLNRKSGADQFHFLVFGRFASLQAPPFRAESFNLFLSLRYRIRHPGPDPGPESIVIAGSYLSGCRIKSGMTHGTITFYLLRPRLFRGNDKKDTIGDRDDGSVTQPLM